MQTSRPIAARPCRDTGISSVKRRQDAAQRVDEGTLGKCLKLIVKGPALNKYAFFVTLSFLILSVITCTLYSQQSNSGVRNYFRDEQISTGSDLLRARTKTQVSDSKESSCPTLPISFSIFSFIQAFSLPLYIFHLPHNSLLSFSTHLVLVLECNVKMYRVS
jgi:hypothetical protein